MLRNSSFLTQESHRIDCELTRRLHEVRKAWDEGYHDVMANVTLVEDKDGR